MRLTRNFDSNIYKIQAMNRFFNKTKIGENGCVEWIGAFSRGGYGVFSYKGSSLKSHRISWEWANSKKIPDCMFVCHSCDNPKCVNPEHLFLGTPKDNTRDMFKKGRWKRNKIGRRTFSEEMKNEILECRLKGRTIDETCEKYNIDHNTILKICRKSKKWKPQKWWYV